MFVYFFFQQILIYFAKNLNNFGNVYFKWERGFVNKELSNLFSKFKKMSKEFQTPIQGRQIRRILSNEVPKSGSATPQSPSVFEIPPSPCLKNLGFGTGAFNFFLILNLSFLIFFSGIAQIRALSIRLLFPTLFWAFY